MRRYVMLVLMSAEFEEPKEEIEKIEEVVRNLGGEIAKTDVWGKKTLAYPIRKKNEGVYVLFNFMFAPEQILELNRVLSLRGNVYRQMIVLLEE